MTTDQIVKQYHVASTTIRKMRHRGEVVPTIIEGVMHYTQEQAREILVRAMNIDRLKKRKFVAYMKASKKAYQPTPKKMCKCGQAAHYYLKGNYWCREHVNK